MVQCIFQDTGKVYFEVNPAVTTECNLDVRRYLCGTFLPAHAQDPVAPQELDKDRPPLLKITLWNKFEPKICKDEGQRPAVWRLKARHAVEEEGGIFAPLGRVVERHHVAARALLNECPNSFTVVKVLLNGRRYIPEQSVFLRLPSRQLLSHLI
jgi:hypothetical protein